MIPDSLFSPPQSPFFSLLKVLVSPSQSPCVLFPSSPSSFFLSKSSPILFVLSPPPQSQKTAERPEAVPPFLVGVVCSKMEHDSFLVRPQTAVARFKHLEAVVPVSQLLPGLAANVMVHSNVKHAVIARPAAAE